MASEGYIDCLLYTSSIRSFLKSLICESVEDMSNTDSQIKLFKNDLMERPVVADKENNDPLNVPPTCLLYTSDPRVYKPTAEQFIGHSDVTSMYPSLAIINRWLPVH